MHTCCTIFMLKLNAYSVFRNRCKGLYGVAIFQLHPTSPLYKKFQTTSYYNPLYQIQVMWLNL